MDYLKALLPKKFEKKHLILLVVLLISSFLRLYNIADTVQFLGDQGRDAMIVSRIFRELDPVFIGPVTSVGNMYLGPLYYYFMMPFLWFTYPSPMGPVYAVAALGILTVFLMYYLGKQFLSERVALIATTLFGFSAIVAQNTRFSWNPNPAPLISLILLFFTYKAVKKDVRYWIGVVVCFAILIQLHYMTLLSGAGFGLIWLYQLFSKIKEKKPIKRLIVSTVIGIVVFFLSLTPLILFDIKHDGLNRKAFLNILTGEQTFSQSSSKGTPISNFLVDFKSRTELILTDLSIGETNDTTNTLLAFSFLILFIYILKIKTMDGKKPLGEFVVFSFLATGILGTAFYNHNVYHHYIAYLFPVSFFSIAIVFNYLLERKFFGKIFVFLFLLLFFQFNFAYGKLILSSQGWTIANIQSVAQTIEDRVQPGEKYNIVLLNGTGDLYGQNYRYFLGTSDNKKIVTEEEFGSVDTLFIIDEERKVDNEANSSIYEIVVFPNKTPVEVYEIPGGPEITVLKKSSN